MAIVVSSSSNSNEREINEYHDESNNSSSSGSDNNASSSSDEHYLSGVLGVPLEVPRKVKAKDGVKFDSWPVLSHTSAYPLFR